MANKKDEERWEALRQAAFDYVKAYNIWFTADCIDEATSEAGEAALAHAEAVLRAAAELSKAGA